MPSISPLQPLLNTFIQKYRTTSAMWDLPADCHYQETGISSVQDIMIILFYHFVAFFNSMLQTISLLRTKTRARKKTRKGRYGYHSVESILSCKNNHHSVVTGRTPVLLKIQLCHKFSRCSRENEHLTVSKSKINKNRKYYHTALYCKMTSGTPLTFGDCFHWQLLYTFPFQESPHY